MTPDPHRRFHSNPEVGEAFQSQVEHRSWDRRLKDTVETPGRISAVFGLVGGLAVAIFYGLLIGSADIKTVAVLSAGLFFVFLLVIAGEYWWALLVWATAIGLRTSEFGFRMTGFELGFAAVTLAYLIRTALRAMKKFKPAVGLGLPFWALSAYLLIHAILVVTYNRYESPGGLKNIVRGYYSVLAPLAFFFLLARHCHPRTVKPVTATFLGITVFTTLVALPVFLLGLNFSSLEELPFGVVWLSPEEVGGILRGAPILATFAVALWPGMRTAPRKWVMGGLLLLSLVAGAASSGRLAFVGVFIVLMLFLLLNRKWGALTAASAALGISILVATTSPDLIDNLPNSMQRAASPLNLSHSEAKQATSLSDRWHEELRTESLKYWTESWTAFIVGHGFGTWDYSLTGDEQWTRDFEYAKKMAVQMGRTENAFSSITNIFGLAGLLLYVWFALDIGKRLLKARKLAAPRSFEKAMCEVSLVYLGMFLLLSPFAGGAPGWDLFYWQLGLLAARPLLAKEEESAKNQPLIRSRRGEEVAVSLKNGGPRKILAPVSRRTAIPSHMRRGL